MRCLLICFVWWSARWRAASTELARPGRAARGLRTPFGAWRWRCLQFRRRESWSAPRRSSPGGSQARISLVISRIVPRTSVISPRHETIVSLNLSWCGLCLIRRVRLLHQFPCLQALVSAGGSGLPVWWNASPTRCAAPRLLPLRPASLAEDDPPLDPSFGHNSSSKKDSSKSFSYTSTRTIGDPSRKSARDGGTYCTPRHGGGMALSASWIAEKCALPVAVVCRGSTTLW